MSRVDVRTTAYVLACATVLALAGFAPTASAQSGGAQAGPPPATDGSPKAPKPEPKPEPRAPSTGGAAVPGPRVTRVRCRTRSRCAGPTSASPGATLELRGRGLARAGSVVFLGIDGAEDDVEVAPRRATRTRVSVRVPRLAASGPVAVVDADGAQSAPSRTRLVVQAAPAAPARGDGRTSIEVSLRSPKVFFDGPRRAAGQFVVHADGPVTVDVAVVRVADGTTVAGWTVESVPPEAPRKVTWDGLDGGRPATPGRYELRVSARGSGAQASSGDGGAAATSGATPGGDDVFELLDHQFPIRGRHTFGTGAAAFGGGRGHQGQDVFAACGTPLVAARGGRVKFRQYHSRAGNYVVIDGEQTGVDYAYMHLRDVALVAEGDRVRTGQLIGHVGQTGRASGCHLHFELWSAPGWYDGGSPFDPLAMLQAWDKTS